METVLPSDLGAREQRSRPAAIANWLFAVAALVFAMVVVGGHHPADRKRPLDHRMETG